MNHKTKILILLIMSMTMILTACFQKEKEDLSLVQSSANYKKALQLIKDNDLSDAEKLLEESIKLNPQEGVYHIALGNIYLDRKEIDTALDNFLISIEKTPKYKEAYNNAAGIYMLDEQYEQALSIVQQGLEVIPEDPELTFKKAQIYFVNNEYKEAINLFQSLLDLDREKFFESYRFIGLCQLNLDLKEEAKDNLEKYIELAPEDIPVRESIKSVLNTL